MICLDHPVFFKKCSKKARSKVARFAEQASLLEAKIRDFGFEPIDFDLGRDDSYQFLIFTLGEISAEVGEFLKDQLSFVIQKNNLDLLDGVYSFKCSTCENLHIACYIKPLSKNNPFKNGEFDDCFYVCDFNSTILIN